MLVEKTLLAQKLNQQIRFFMQLPRMIPFLPFFLSDFMRHALNCASNLFRAHEVVLLDHDVRHINSVI